MSANTVAVLCVAGVLLAPRAARAQDVETLLRRGESSERMGQPKAAVMSYQQAVRAAPDNATAQFRLGRALLASNELQDGAGHLAKAVELGVNEPQAYLLLAMYYDARDDAARALAVYEQAEKKFPNDAALRREYGATLLQRGDVAGALQRLAAAAQAAPNDADTQAVYGYALATGGRGEAALAPLGQAEKLYRGQRNRLELADVLTNKGVALLALGRDADAGAALREALGFDARNARAAFYYGLTLAAAGDDAGAQKQYATAITGGYATPRVFIALGNVHGRAKRYDAAEQAYKKALALDARDVAALTYLAYLYRERKDDAGFKWATGQIEAIDPKNANLKALRSPSR